MKIGIKTLLMAGIMGIAVVAGVFQSLSSPRKKEEKGGEEEKKKEEGKALEGGNCDGL